MSKGQTVEALSSIKVAPPRTHRAVINRERLAARFQRVRDCALVVVQAPEGYGKTSLLAWMRREWLAAGACVGWLSLDADDDERRFVEGLLHSAYVALGRTRDYRASLLRLRNVTAQEALAILLAELADYARSVVLFLDDAHALPEAVARELLAYLALNLPPSVRLVVGSRRPLAFPTADLLAHGQFAQFDVNDLALRIDETRRIVQARFGETVNLDTIARVHEVAAGWPMGLQLAIVAAEREDDPTEALTRIAELSSGLHSHFAEAILPRLPPTLFDFLVDVAPLERLHPGLCAAMTLRADAADLLRRVRDETPLALASEGSDWLRLHAVARAALSRRFDARSQPEREAFLWRAAQWLHAEGMDDEAARHALAAGHVDTAQQWIAQALHDLVVAGRVDSAIAWFERLPEDVMLGQVRARLAIAWARALSRKAREVAPLIEPLLAPYVDAAVRSEALQIKGAAATHADDLQSAAAVSELVGERLSRDDFVLRATHACLRATLALARGDAAGVRKELARAGLPSKEGPLDYAQCYAQFYVALSHLADARPLAAVRALERPLAEADALFGRRSPPSCLLASALAAALWQQDRREDAEATLADRLDVVERSSLPPGMVLAYVTLARIALAKEQSGRAHDLLEALEALGETNAQPRLVIAALAERVRLYAATGQPDACMRVLERLRAQRAAWQGREAGLADLLDRACAIAEVRAMLSARRPAEAKTMLARVVDSTLTPRCASERLELCVLQWEGARAGGDENSELLREAATIASVDGPTRLVDDARSNARGPPGTAVTAKATAALEAPTAPASERSPAPPAPIVATASGMLTPKESAILELLAHNYSNKEIARSLDVGLETIKWHMRNLFMKLNAGSRRHAVERARLLHLVPPLP